MAAESIAPGPPSLAELEAPETATAVQSSDRPWLYGLLVAPSAVMANGVVQGGVIAYILKQQGVGSGQQSHLIALLSLPTSIYFLWGPLTDFFVRRRTWVLLGGLGAATLAYFALQQKSLVSPTVFALLFLAVCCTQLIVSSCGGMMGAMRSEGSRRVAGSFYQAGGMGFGALAAWVLIEFVYRGAHASTLATIAAALIGVPALFALAAPAQRVVRDETYGATLRRIRRECRETFWRWEALPYIACMVFPMASGAAVGLLPGIASSYHVDGNHVAWINGLVGGLLIAAGSMLMSLVRTRLRAPVLYMIVALINVLCLAILWLGPLTPAVYYLGVCSYVFTVGCCYAVFTSVILECLGNSGKSGSGRYSVINGIGNIPVLYMIALDGWGGDRWGARGLAGTEAVVGAVGALVLLAWLLSMKRFRSA